MSDSSLSSYAAPSRFLGFFTIMLIFTLDASNGKDLLDVIVPYIESLTHINMGK